MQQTGMCFSLKKKNCTNLQRILKIEVSPLKTCRTSKRHFPPFRRFLNIDENWKNPNIPPYCSKIVQ